MSRSVIELALRRYFRRDADPNASASQALAQYDADRRTAALHEAAEFVDNDDDCGCGGCDSCVPRKLAAGLRDMAEEKSSPAGADATPAPIVYRASHESIPMGLYTTAAEARAHCVAEERRSWAKGEAIVFDWIEDEEDGVAELVTVDEDGETETVTGYVVEAVEVASKYDPEADE